MTRSSPHRPLACTAIIVALALAGCASNRQAGTPAHTASDDSAMMAASNGASAVFRADVAPILCRYAQDVANSAEMIVRASSDAGGPINASAPQSAQAEYARAVQLYASRLAADYAAFAKTHAPPPFQSEYRQFLESLSVIEQQATQLARYAHAGNYTAIANEQGLQTPTAGQRVFRNAGITSCAIPTP
jgi:hypothetical protein